MIDISPSFVIAVFVYGVTDNGCVAIIAYVSAFLHELSHIFTAYISGYKLKKISVFACGFHAAFKDFENPPFSHETAIAFSGPLSNLLIAVAAGAGLYGYGAASIVVKINVYMFALNLLPVMPFDGGRIVYAFLKNEMSVKKAKKYMNIISVSVVLLSLTVSGIYAFVFDDNIAFLVVNLYMLYNIVLLDNRKTDEDSDEVKRTKLYTVSKDCKLSDVILKVGIDKNILVFVTDADGNFYGYITGGDIKRAAFENMYGVSALTLTRKFTDGGNLNGY